MERWEAVWHETVGRLTALEALVFAIAAYHPNPDSLRDQFRRNIEAAIDLHLPLAMPEPVIDALRRCGDAYAKMLSAPPPAQQP